jgi:ATP-dependent Clp protease adaptor protein ClpS
VERARMTRSPLLDQFRKSPAQLLQRSFGGLFRKRGHPAAGPVVDEDELAIGKEPRPSGEVTNEREGVILLRERGRGILAASLEDLVYPCPYQASVPKSQAVTSWLVSSMLPPESQFEESAVAESAEKVHEPPLFKVLLHNDDYTTMEFVVWVLESVFNMAVDQAVQVMLNVHTKGIGIAGVYTYEVAEMKVTKTTELARESEYPLLCTMEKA